MVYALLAKLDRLQQNGEPTMQNLPRGWQPSMAWRGPDRLIEKDLQPISSVHRYRS